MKKIGFIGMGNMGYAILKGLLQVFDKTELIFYRCKSGESRGSFPRDRS